MGYLFVVSRCMPYFKRRFLLSVFVLLDMDSAVVLALFFLICLVFGLKNFLDS